MNGRRWTDQKCEYNTTKFIIWRTGGRRKSIDVMGELWFWKKCVFNSFHYCFVFSKFCYQKKLKNQKVRIPEKNSNFLANFSNFSSKFSNFLSKFSNFSSKFLIFRSKFLIFLSKFWPKTSKFLLKNKQILLKKQKHEESEGVERNGPEIGR